MKHKKIKLLALVLFFGVSTSYAQVSIGDRPTPDSAAILDLRNTSDLGLLLPTATVNPGALDDADVIPLGMLYYYEGNLFLKDSINTGSPTDDFTGVTPWKSIFTGAKPVDVYFNPSDWDDYDPSSPASSSKWGVGIGLSSGVKGNLHIALKNKDVNAGNTQSPLLIGDSDADIHMELDNDEILVKTNQNTPGTLKLQEGGGTVQVGESITNTSTLNVFGKVKEHGNELVPQGVIVTWWGSSSNVPAGWALCDGQKWRINPTTGVSEVDPSGALTPDLKDRFVIGAGTSYTVHDDYGADSTSVTLVKENIPKHKHILVNGEDGCSSGTVSAGAHTHGISVDDGGGSGTDLIEWDNDMGADNTLNTNSAGAHTHILSGDTGDGTTDLGEDVTSFKVAIIPTSLALYYIMKL